jgi:hypothetical protein
VKWLKGQKFSTRSKQNIFTSSKFATKEEAEKGFLNISKLSTIRRDYTQHSATNPRLTLKENLRNVLNQLSVFEGKISEPISQSYH